MRQSSTKPFPFQCLPSEVRNQIYSYLLQEGESIEAFDIFRNTTRWPAKLPLLNTSLAIRHEAFQTWLQVNAIQLSKRLAHLVNYFDTRIVRQSPSFDFMSNIHHAIVVVGDQSLLSDMGELHTIGNLLTSAVRLRSLEFHVLRDYPLVNEGVHEATWYSQMVVELLESAPKFRAVTIKPMLRDAETRPNQAYVDLLVGFGGTNAEYLTLQIENAKSHAEELHRALVSVTAGRPDLSVTLQSPARLEMLGNTYKRPGGYTDPAKRDDQEEIEDDVKQLLAEHGEDIGDYDELENLGESSFIDDYPTPEGEGYGPSASEWSELMGIRYVT